QHLLLGSTETSDFRRRSGRPWPRRTRAALSTTFPWPCLGPSGEGVAPWDRRPPYSSLVVALGPLGGALRRFLRALRAGGRLAEHIDEDEVAERRRRGGAEMTRIGVVAHHLGRVPEGRVLGVRRPNRIILIGLQRLRNVAVRRLLPGFILLSLPHPA